MAFVFVRVLPFPWCSNGAHFSFASTVEYGITIHFAMQWHFQLFFFSHFCPIRICVPHDYYTIKTYCCAKCPSISIAISRVSARLAYFTIYRIWATRLRLRMACTWIILRIFLAPSGIFGYIHYSLLTVSRKWVATKEKHISIPLALRPAIKNNSSMRMRILKWISFTEMCLLVLFAGDSVAPTNRQQQLFRSFSSSECVSVCTCVAHIFAIIRCDSKQIRLSSGSARTLALYDCVATDTHRQPPSRKYIVSQIVFCFLAFSFLKTAIACGACRFTFLLRLCAAACINKA